MEQDQNDEEEEEETEERSETEFNFKSYVMKFVSPNVASAYVTLLRECRRNSSLTNHALVKMLHRIGFDHGMIGMLFQASLFRVFHKVLQDPACNVKQFNEIRQFAKYVLRRFFEVAANNSKVYMELFFWKNVKESMEVAEGYGTVEMKKTTKQQWTEEQDDELRCLFDEYKEKEEAEGSMGQDVADFCMMNLIDQTRTRRHIIKHLSYLGLIESAKDIKLKKSRGTSRQWTEHEEEELRRLHEEHKESLNPMGNILDGLSLKRSRTVVLNKLRELGLIESNQEMRKKSGKSTGGGTSAWNKPDDGRVLPTWSSSDESEDEEARMKRLQARALEREMNAMDRGSDSDSDLSSSSSPSSGSEAELGHAGNEAARDSGSDAGNSGKENQPSTSTKKKVEKRQILSAPKRKKNVAKDSGSGGNVTQIQKALRKALNEDQKEAIDWLKVCLERTADDKEEEADDEAIPIVPITDQQEDAMENSAFKSLLKKVGVNPPASEQERFWRISGSLSVEDLRRNAQALVPMAAETMEEPQRPPKAKKNNARFEMLKAMAEQKKTGKRSMHKKTVRQADSSDDDDQPAATGSNQSPPARSKRMLTSDSNSSGEEKEHNSSPMKKPSSKRVRLIKPNSDSDESDEDQSRPASQMDQSQPTSQPETSQSNARDESEDEAMDQSRPRSRKMVESDSESDAETPNKASKGTELNSFPATMYSEPLSDSDSELDDHIPLRKAKKAAAIISDDDD